MTDTSSNKRLAKNTFVLYIRMFVMMAISLYTSRLILETLGIKDFGVYNIVGGVVTLFSFINNATVRSAQRFLNYSMEKYDENTTIKTFSMCLNCQYIFIIILFVLSETIGLWFLNNYLNIPHCRIFAANIVYQCSIIATCVNMLYSPYNAAIIAFEKMTIYAYISMLEAVLKLAIVYILFVGHYDKLIIYGILTLIVSCIVSAIYILYCLKKFNVCRYKWAWDRDLFRKIIGFSGWNFFETVANMVATQGLNLIFNMFFGVVVNAAMGIANQVNNAINKFVTGFETAYNPQITKSFADGNKDSFFSLLYRTSKFSYYLLFVVGLPVIICCHQILNLWLVEVPNYSTEFCQLMIIYSFIDAITTPLWMTILSEGNIKVCQIVTSTIKMFILPISIVQLYCGMSPTSVLFVNILLNVIINIFRLSYLHRIVDLNLKEYYKNVLSPSINVTLCSFPIPMAIFFLSDKTFGPLIMIVFASIACSILSISYLGINKVERTAIKQYISSKIHFKQSDR